MPTTPPPTSASGWCAIWGESVDPTRLLSPVSYSGTIATPDSQEDCLTSLVAFEAEALATLDEQLWRRLGVTQTFDRLLVVAVATAPGAVNDVRDHAGRNLSGGAAKFWTLSFPQLLKDLVRRRIVVNAGGQVQLHDEFADKLSRLLKAHEDGVSRVEPTPGVTLEELNARAALRARSEKKTSRSRSTTTRSSKAKSKAKAAATPRKRSSAAAAPTPDAGPKETVISLSAPKPTPTVAPPNTLFTTLKLNKLLDHLDNMALSKIQLGDRLSLHGANLERFLEVTGQAEITRIKREDLVELHWEGRKLVKTSGGDRRMAVHQLVDQLRKRASADAE